ncbi:MAG: MMPL family transporter [Treponema sp.]|nr:MMPL family transporter [Treponema sp.]
MLSFVFGKKLNIDSDLFHMLPTSTLGPVMGEADERLSDATAQNVFVLVSHEDFEKAKETAENVYNQLKDNSFFTSLTLYAGDNTIRTIEDFVHPYRWNLLNDDVIQELSTQDGLSEFAENAAVKAYSSFTMSSLDYLDEDPFLLDDEAVTAYLGAIQEAGTAMTAKDGVLASEYQGKWYVMIRGTLSKEGGAIASSNNGITSIYSVCGPLEKDGIRFVYSGTAFHSHKNSTSALKEISVISTISLVIVILILLLIFRSALPLAVSVVSILVSVSTAFAATHFVYGGLHILTLVLGTSLIGSCIDYSLHFFVNWKANNALDSGAAVRKFLFKGLTLSLVSTEICYFILIFAPFDLLKQMGVFSMTGIMSSFLSVICIYPLFRVPQESKRKIPLIKYYRHSTLARKKYLTLTVSCILIVLTGVIIAVHHKNLRIENDLNKLYTMEGRLKEDRQTVADITQYNPVGWFILHGKTEEELLQTEEFVCAKLEELGRGKAGGGYLAVSRFIPSIEHQKKSRAASKKLLALASEQYQMLGYEEGEELYLDEEFDSSEENYLLPGAELPAAVSSIVSMLWLGQIEGEYYSVVMPVTNMAGDEYVRIASERSDSVIYENKIKDLGLGLDHLTLIVIVMFAIAYILILIVLKFFYKWKHTLKIASIPLISVLVILAVNMVIGQPVEFFGLTGMILVFGLGLDYIIYMIENIKREKKGLVQNETPKLEPFAILLSFLTTALSFGALAFSNFVPVHTIGLTIFLGLISAFVCTLF